MIILTYTFAIRLDRKTILKRKSGFTINPKDWSIEKGQPKQSREDLKVLKSRLDKLAVFVNDAYNGAISKGVLFTGDWLQEQIDLFNNKIKIIDFDILTNSIDAYIENGDNLTKGSVKNLENLKTFISNYENEALKGKKILIRNIDLNFIDVFKKYHINKGRSVNYIGTYLSLLRAVVNKASQNGIPTHPQFSQIKMIKEHREPDEIIILTEEEQELIKKADIKLQSHINARKWLLLGCLIGQRAGRFIKHYRKKFKRYKRYENY